MKTEDTKAIKCKMSLEERRALLDSAGSHFFSCEFVKKSGELRQMTAKRWMDKAYAHGKANAVKPTLADKPEYFLAVDTAKEQFRAINLNSLRSARVNGKLYVFE